MLAASSITDFMESALSAFCKVLAITLACSDPSFLVPEPSSVPKAFAATCITSLRSSALSAFLKTEPRLSLFCAPRSAATCTTSFTESACDTLLNTDSKLSLSFAPINEATATTSLTSAAFCESSRRLSNMASLFTPIASASMVTSTTSSKLFTKSETNDASSLPPSEALRFERLSSTFSSNLADATTATSTYMSILPA